MKPRHYLSRIFIRTVLLATAASCVLMAGCATNTWVATQIEEGQKKHRSDLSAMTQKVQQSLAQETAKNQKRTKILDDLAGDIQRLEKELNTLKANIDTLRAEISARLQTQDKEMTETFQKADGKVHSELLAKHQEAVDSIRQEMQKVEGANRHADQLATTLQEMASVYRSIAQDTADEYKALESSVNEISVQKTVPHASPPAAGSPPKAP